VSSSARAPSEEAKACAATDAERAAERKTKERKSERKDMQDKGARHDCRVKPMSAHGFLQHVENRHRAAEDCKFLMIAEISRVIHVGVRLNKTRIARSQGRHLALNDRYLEV